MTCTGREQEKCAQLDPDADLRELVKEFCVLHKKEIDFGNPAEVAIYASELDEARARIKACIPVTEWGAMAIEIICSREAPMTRMNRERFRRQRVYEPDVPVEFQDKPQGPSKADLRAQAARAVAEYRKPVSEAPAASPSRAKPKLEPPVVTPASTILRDLTIECQCGHKATIHRAPADVIGRRLRCTSCGEEPSPF